MFQERCIRRSVSQGRLWGVGEVRNVKNCDEDGNPVVSPHFRLVGPTESVSNKEYHSPEAVADAKINASLEDKAAAITNALGLLDPDNDGDWTVQGYPLVQRVHTITGMEITRGDLQEAYPEFDRDYARELKGS